MTDNMAKPRAKIASRSSQSRTARALGDSTIASNIRFSATLRIAAGTSSLVTVPVGSPSQAVRQRRFRARAALAPIGAVTGTPARHMYARLPPKARHVRLLRLCTCSPASTPAKVR